MKKFIKIDLPKHLDQGHMMTKRIHIMVDFNSEFNYNLNMLANGC